MNEYEVLSRLGVPVVKCKKCDGIGSYYAYYSQIEQPPSLECTACDGQGYHIVKPLKYKEVYPVDVKIDCSLYKELRNDKGMILDMMEELIGAACLAGCIPEMKRYGRLHRCIKYLEANHRHLKKYFMRHNSLEFIVVASSQHRAFKTAYRHTGATGDDEMQLYSSEKINLLD